MAQKIAGEKREKRTEKIVRAGKEFPRSRWYFKARIDLTVAEEYILFTPLLHHFSCCHSAEADSHSHSFKRTITTAYK